MTVFLNDNQYYQTYFMGLVEHSFSTLTDEPLVRVGLMYQSEWAGTRLIRVNSRVITIPSRLGVAIDLGNVVGSDLYGFRAGFDDLTGTVDKSYRATFEDVMALKNIESFYLLGNQKNIEKGGMMMESPVTIKGSSLKSVRDILNIKQSVLMTVFGLSERSYRNIENSDELLADKYYQLLVEKYPELNEKLSLQFDWVSITFSDMTAKQVIQEVLRMKESLFLLRSTSQNFYSEEYAFAGEKNFYVQGHAPVLDTQTDRMQQETGATLYLTGQGTRIFESVLHEQALTWKRFMVRARRFNGHLTRLDLAINDTHGFFNMDDIVRAVQEKRFWSKSRSYAIHGNETAGWTVNFGKSPFVIRIYDKYLEQQQKGIDTNTKNRIELELHGDKAEAVIDEWLGSDDLVPYTLSILKTYLWFVNEKIDESERQKSDHLRERYIDKLKPLSAWDLITSMGSKMRFKSDPKVQSVESIERWIYKYVAPSLRVLKETGRWQDVLEKVEEADLSDEQMKMITATNSTVMSSVLPNFKAELDKKAIVKKDGHEVRLHEMTDEMWDELEKMGLLREDVVVSVEAKKEQV
ncbi:DNA relaxase NicK (NicK) [Fructobacillus cardui]|uniref:replication initiation factor domain-containing protein n=1 Tax=Fructobacillus cardui TaxID=2893170 RepID=UPI002D8ACB0F|nr:DNA relaxase NicK (NicK) [Fructobacillus cardui]CAK1253833.1 DNA relaxase NicK (NicK) [Fructobacillus cardui]